LDKEEKSILYDRKYTKISKLLKRLCYGSLDEKDTVKVKEEIRKHPEFIDLFLECLRSRKSMAIPGNPNARKIGDLLILFETSVCIDPLVLFLEVAEKSTDEFFYDCSREYSVIVICGAIVDKENSIEVLRSSQPKDRVHYIVAKGLLEYTRNLNARKEMVSILTSDERTAIRENLLKEKTENYVKATEALSLFGIEAGNALLKLYRKARWQRCDSDDLGEIASILLSTPGIIPWIREKCRKREYKKMLRRIDPEEVRTEEVFIELIQMKVCKASLNLAAKKGYCEAVSRLLAKGSNCNKASSNGFTPLHQASRMGHPDVVRCLLDHGADVMARAELGETPLLMAITSRWDATANPDVVRCLVEYGADVTAMDHDGWTPLYAAAQRGSIDVAKVLLGAGAPIDQRTDFGQTPLDRATLGHKQEMVRFLRESRKTSFKTSTPENDLLGLLAEAQKWGEKHSYPVMKRYPQYARIRDIGSQVHNQGGLDAMQAMYYKIREGDLKLALLLDHMWDGVGNWAV
jgi:hypothetical protein